MTMNTFSSCPTAVVVPYAVGHDLPEYGYSVMKDR